MHQPLTATQLAKRARLNFNTCRDVMLRLARAEVLKCLNPKARRGRVYWFTAQGDAYLRNCFEHYRRPVPDCSLPAIDWDLYGWTCFSHRSAIIKILDRPMQPAHMKRKCRARFADLRMSTNNARDVIRLFRARGIVEPVQIRRKVHTHFTLSERGQEFQSLHLSAEVPA